MAARGCYTELHVYQTTSAEIPCIGAADVTQKWCMRTGSSLQKYPNTSAHPVRPVVEVMEVVGVEGRPEARNRCRGGANGAEVIIDAG